LISVVPYLTDINYDEISIIKILILLLFNHLYAKLMRSNIYSSIIDGSGILSIGNSPKIINFVCTRIFFNRF